MNDEPNHEGTERDDGGREERGDGSEESARAYICLLVRTGHVWLCLSGNTDR